MSVARVTEITSQSPRSFEAAVRQGIERANATLRNVTGAWVKEQQVQVEDGKITGFRVNMLVTFVLDGDMPVSRTMPGNSAAAKTATKAPAKKAAKKASKSRR